MCSFFLFRRLCWSNASKALHFSIARRTDGKSERTCRWAPKDVKRLVCISVHLTCPLVISAAAARLSRCACDVSRYNPFVYCPFYYCSQILLAEASILLESIIKQCVCVRVCVCFLLVDTDVVMSPWPMQLWGLAFQKGSYLCSTSFASRLVNTISHSLMPSYLQLNTHADFFI